VCVEVCKRDLCVGVKLFYDNCVSSVWYLCIECGVFKCGFGFRVSKFWCGFADNFGVTIYLR